MNSIHTETTCEAFLTLKRRLCALVSGLPEECVLYVVYVHKSVVYLWNVCCMSFMCTSQWFTCGMCAVCRLCAQVSGLAVECVLYVVYVHKSVVYLWNVCCMSFMCTSQWFTCGMCAVCRLCAQVSGLPVECVLYVVYVHKSVVYLWNVCCMSSAAYSPPSFRRSTKFPPLGQIILQ